MTESKPPNPFSREGSQPSDELSADSNPGTPTPPHQPSGGGSNDKGAADWPSYPAGDPYGTSSADPYAMPSNEYGNQANDSLYAGPAAGFETQAPPPYGDVSQGYAQATDYGGSHYEVNPYQPTFGGVSPYGPVPSGVIPTQHPQATLALILGILGTVLGMGCIVGGLVGIGGIVVGRRVRKEIDAEPGRYTGRSQAVAGFILGIVGVSIFALITALIVVGVIVGITSSDF
jgi:hypothetical protein